MPLLIPDFLISLLPMIFSSLPLDFLSVFSLNTEDIRSETVEFLPSTLPLLLSPSCPSTYRFLLQFHFLRLALCYYFQILPLVLLIPFPPMFFLLYHLLFFFFSIIYLPCHLSSGSFPLLSSMPSHVPLVPKDFCLLRSSETALTKISPSQI